MKVAGYYNRFIIIVNDYDNSNKWKWQFLIASFGINETNN